MLLLKLIASSLRFILVFFLKPEEKNKLFHLQVQMMTLVSSQAYLQKSIYLQFIKRKLEQSGTGYADGVD